VFVLVDPSSATPVFAQIATSIATQIATGTIATGARLPAAKELADSLGVNVHTVLRAYQGLRDEGQVELPARSGRRRSRRAYRRPGQRRRGTRRGRGEGRRHPDRHLLALVRKEYES
jgi:GntR family transcriptional regulator